MIFVILTSIFFFVCVLIFVYWAIIFLIRIYYSRKYMRGAARHLTDKESVYLCTQICYHYQTEIGKYLFLLVINVVEVVGGFSYYITYLLKTYNPINYINPCYQMVLEEFAKRNNSILIDSLIYTIDNPMLVIIGAVGHVADLFVVGFGVCLISYLIGRMKNMNTIIMNIKRFILFLSVISVFIIVFSFFVFFINLVRVFFLSALIVYYIMFWMHVKRFKQALLQIAIERLAQHGSNRIEMRQYKYFSYSMNCVCSGFFLILIAVHIGFFTRLIIRGIFFGNCYFPFNYLGYQSILSLTNQDTTKIATILNYMGTLEHITGSIGLFLWLFPLVFITICIWLKSVYMNIVGKSSIKFRYNMSSTF